MCHNAIKRWSLYGIVCVCVRTPKKSICRFVYDMNVDFVYSILYTQHKHTHTHSTIKRTKRTSWHFSWFDFPTDCYIMICYSYMVLSFRITIFYMRCSNVDRPLCFRPENIYGCFFASSSIDVECERVCVWAMKFSLGFFPLRYSANNHLRGGYTKRHIEAEKAREREWLKW